MASAVLFTFTGVMRICFGNIYSVKQVIPECYVIPGFEKKPTKAKASDRSWDREAGGSVGWEVSCQPSMQQSAKIRRHSSPGEISRDGSGM